MKIIIQIIVCQKFLKFYFFDQILLFLSKLAFISISFKEVIIKNFEKLFHDSKNVSTLI